MDLINRDEAIKEIKRFTGYLDEDMITRLDIAINKIPTALMWIPVSERLPEKPKDSEIRRRWYLVSLASGCVESLAFEFENEQWGYVGTGTDVLAWMPLPEPFKEESK